MKKIAIIGAGQLGSRHLQGVAQSNLEISIEVVEPFMKSLEIAKQRYHEIKNNNFVKDISFFDSIDKLSNNIDLVIIATSADVRFKVVTQLLTEKKVKNLVLEKVLFQKVDEYFKVESLLKKTGTECWVNHPRRMFPFYKNLKLKFKDVNQISYNLQGGSWGLGSNALHLIDHLLYLSNLSNFELSISNEFLDNEIYKSKRDNYIEFNGLLVGKLGNNNFSLYSSDKYIPEIHTIVSEDIVLKLNEADGSVEISEKKNNWEWKKYHEKITFFQSELSNIIVDDILIKNKCDLPTYKEAMKLHIPVIECLLNHMNKVNGKKNTLCPIT